LFKYDAMSASHSQLQSLLSAVQALLDSHQTLKQANEALAQELEEKTRELASLTQDVVSSNNLSTPPSTPSALSADELDALVEEIDNCIALLTR